jgi:cytidylate kinase
LTGDAGASERDQILGPLIALDGHDGSGKTTLAIAFADRIGGSYARPFSGTLGKELLKAGESGDVEGVVELGQRGLDRAIAEAERFPVVLDRSWITVASLIASESLAKWTVRIPTVLCFSDLRTTLERLELRTDEFLEPVAWHTRFLEIYLDIAERHNVPILRTDTGDPISVTLDKLEQLARFVRTSDGTPVVVAGSLPRGSSRVM